MLKKLCLALVMLLLPAAALADVVISEVMASNGVYDNGESYDWVELHNDGSKTVDLSGWHLSDGRKNLEKFTFPQGTKLKSGAYLIVYCTGEDEIEPGKGSKFYAPFSLSADGETLYLSNAGVEPVQTLKYPQQYVNISYGCPAGGGEYGYFEAGTPGKKNGAIVYGAVTEAPTALTAGGFYPEGVTVSVTAPRGAILRYTTDGETPTIRDREIPADGLTITETTALRVRAFREGEVPSATVSATYLIEAEQLTPVVCLVTDDQYLFNRRTGALVKGSGDTPNYAKELEYPVNIEYFNLEGVCEINQVGTFTASGHSARQNAQKSIALYARKAYGGDVFAFNPFPTRDYPGYKSLLLRAANSDFSATRLRDVVGSSLAEGEGFSIRITSSSRCTSTANTGVITTCARRSTSTSSPSTRASPTRPLSTPSTSSPVPAPTATRRTATTRTGWSCATSARPMT